MPNNRKPTSPEDPEAGAARRPTIKDVAAALGVSHTTVSLSLRGSSRITEQRRKEVGKMAQKMGYRLNPMGAGLAQFRAASRELPIQSSIAWLNFWREPEMLRTYLEFDLYWKGAEEAARRWGYRLEEFRDDPKIPVSRLTSILQARSVRGILLPPHGGSNIERAKKVIALDWSQFAVVRFGYSMSFLNVSVVGSDHVANMRIVLKRLREKKYRRIGFVTEIAGSGHWLEGFMGKSVRFPLNEQVPPLLLPVKDAEQKMAFSSWFDKYKPDALVTDIPAIRNWLLEKGVGVPDDLGLVAMSVLDGEADAGIDQRSYEIGRAAAEVLISRINNEDFGESEFCRQVVIRGRWVEGSTVRDMA